MFEGGGGGGATGLLNKGGGREATARLPVEFPQVQTSLYNNTLAHSTVTNDNIGHHE